MAKKGDILLSIEASESMRCSIAKKLQKIPIVPVMALPKRSGRFVLFILNFSLFLIITINAMKNAMKFLKKAFWTKCKSPAIRINTAISEKKNAERIIKKIPLYFVFISRPPVCIYEDNIF